jgi:hypothetical protein
MTNKNTDQKQSHSVLLSLNSYVSNAYSMLESLPADIFGKDNICENRDEKSYALSELNSCTRKIADALALMQNKQIGGLNE